VPNPPDRDRDRRAERNVLGVANAVPFYSRQNGDL
jgi:hypothetical protein